MLRSISWGLLELKQMPLLKIEAIVSRVALKQINSEGFYFLASESLRPAMNH